MVPIIFKDIDAICLSRKNYVSDDFPLIGYNAIFRRYVNRILRERKKELRAMLPRDYYKSYYKKGATAERVAKLLNDVFSLDCMFLDQEDEMRALLFGKTDHFEMIDLCTQIRSVFRLDGDDLLLDTTLNRTLTFSQLVNFCQGNGV